MITINQPPNQPPLQLTTTRVISSYNHQNNYNHNQPGAPALECPFPLCHCTTAPCCSPPCSLSSAHLTQTPEELHLILNIELFLRLLLGQTPVAPSPEVKPVRVFSIITAQTCGADHQILNQLNSQGLRITPADDLQHCDVVLLFCPIVSRIGSDVAAAVKMIPVAPSPVLKPVRVFSIITAQTCGADHQILNQLNSQGLRITAADDLQHCDVVLLFCPIVSRIGSDVAAAVKMIPDEILDKTCWSAEYPCINQEVRVLFHKTQNGLLQCPTNQEAVRTLHSLCNQYKNRSQQDEHSLQSQSYTKVAPSPEVKPVRVFSIITAQTCGADHQILNQLNSQGLMITPADDLQHCDVVLLFCPIVSRIGSDVAAAVKMIPAPGKPVVLVLMHHTFDPDEILDKTCWSAEYPCINQEVRVLFHKTQNGLLQCPTNQEAVRTLQSLCNQYKNSSQQDEHSRQSQSYTKK
ncbi:hypothetical protein WMY93_007401 [Mugilogobius chulae]|uniref:Uncharacterized protein n=1 Tax=Mugilogobius chulae TaxID=88201 RepID=A0AAW0PCY1_9GOBI